MKRFVLDRREDETGVSGTGYIAEGVLFDNGKCALAWLSRYHSVTVFDNIEARNQQMNDQAQRVPCHQDVAASAQRKDRQPVFPCERQCLQQFV